MLRVKRVKNSIFKVIFVIVVVLLVNGFIAVKYSGSPFLPKSGIESNIGGPKQSNEFVVNEDDDEIDDTELHSDQVADMEYSIQTGRRIENLCSFERNAFIFPKIKVEFF